jgi:hypothetical protein
VRTIVVLEVIPELRACASASTVLRSIDDALLERVQVTVPVDASEQLSVPAASTGDPPLQTASTATNNVPSLLCIRGV